MCRGGPKPGVGSSISRSENVPLVSTPPALTVTRNPSPRSICRPPPGRKMKAPPAATFMVRSPPLAAFEPTRPRHPPSTIRASGSDPFALRVEQRLLRHLEPDPLPEHLDLAAATHLGSVRRQIGISDAP